MQNFEKLENPCVIYHAECSDGFGAAYAARKVFGDSATYLPGYHGRGIPQGVDGKDVVILDFSFKRKEYFELLDRANSVQLIDHHASAMKDLEGAPGVFFDMSKSGARLAWEAFVGQDIPDLIRYIEDIDLWKFQYPETQHVFYGLDTLPMDFEAWAPFLDGPEANRKTHELILDGAAIEKWVQKQVGVLVGKAKTIELLGQSGLAINAPPMIVNEVGAALAQKCGTFGLVWNEDSQGDLKCSLRSVRDFDASAIAVALGGGGHKNACAFRVSKEECSPIQAIAKMAKNEASLLLTTHRHECR